jgi:hypothetical protein
MTKHFSIAAAQELIRFDTVNPPGSERPVRSGWGSWRIQVSPSN